MKTGSKTTLHGQDPQRTNMQAEQATLSLIESTTV